MDHHCPWVANCVGFYNYKYFLNMLYSTSATCLLICFTSWPVVGSILNSEEENYFVAYYIIVSYFLIAAMGLIITLFFTFHLHLIYTGKTTIEFCEKKSFKDENGQTIWDLGPKRNFEAILGPNKLFWFIPTAPTHLGDGLRFEPNPNFNMQAYKEKA